MRRIDSKAGFSLIEVLFAISFLVMVGVAMISLNSAAARLSETTELKQVGLALNEQTINFIALEKRTRDDFAAAYASCASGQTCYVVCPAETDQACSLQSTRQAVQVGSNKLQFAQSVKIQLASDSTDHYLVNATSSWGSGIGRQITTARILE